MIDGEYVSYKDIAARLPIPRTDIIYVISDILELAKACREHGEKFDCVEFIRSLQQVVGEDGTLLFPLFNWDFCKGIPFDYNKTRGKTGALGNAALAMPGFMRTLHPIYSFAVWGKKQRELVNIENKSSFGEDSPFGYMYKNNAKALVIGLTATIGNTFIYYAEQAIGVEFRYEKTFSALYTDAHQKTSQRDYTMYVRDLEMNPEHTGFSAIDDIMSRLCISKDYIINNIPFHVLNLQGVYEVVKLDIIYNQAKNMYKYNPKNEGWLKDEQ